MEEFKKLKLEEKLIKGITEMGYKKPTKIQEKCIPEIKAGKDVVGQSLTGSGKTAAFGLPLIEKVIPGNGIQAIILTPTRELCLQVKDSLNTMSKYYPINIKAIFGGVGYYQQHEDIKIAEIIVATPGRLIDHLERRTIKLDKIKYVVLDEADRMFDMGFEKEVNKILGHVPKERQTIMFSATVPSSIKHTIERYLKNPVFIKEQLHVDKSLLKQCYYPVPRENKFSLLIHLLKKSFGPTIIFCGRKTEVDRLVTNVKKQGFASMPIHGDIQQNKRQLAVKLFKEGKVDILIATDVAARGLDINDITHVYNYDLPKNAEEYTHRIGRTARAGKSGEAISLLSHEDYKNFSYITRSGIVIEKKDLPEFEIIELPRQPRSFNNSFSRGSGRDSRGFSKNRSFRDRGNDRPRFGGRSRDSPRDGGFSSESSFDKPRSFRSNDSQRSGGFGTDRKSFGEKKFFKKSSGPKSTGRDFAKKSFGDKPAFRNREHSGPKEESSFPKKFGNKKPFRKKAGEGFSFPKKKFGDKSKNGFPAKSKVKKYVAKRYDDD
ncbi:MAG: DEAD/DEAH box helicase [Candidatus ainarchaeum sp.]|nr:DEAD/DEAH box helicase [Candidatus ainarchaeum sp.]